MNPSVPTVILFAVEGPRTAAALLSRNTRIIGFAAADGISPPQPFESNLAQALAQFPHRVYGDAVLGIAAEWMLDVPPPQAYDDIGAMTRMLDTPARFIGHGRDTLNDWRMQVLLRYAEDIYRAYQSLRPQLDNSAAGRAYREMEMGAIPAVVAMIASGVRVDLPYLQQLRRGLRRELTDATSQLRQAAGRDVTLRPRDLRQFLFSDLRLPVSSHTKSGKPAVDDDALEQLAAQHVIPERILACRRLKSPATAAERLVRLARTDGRVHANLHLGSVGNVRLASGEIDFGALPHGLRRAILPSEGCVLIEAEVPQMDLRLLAWAAGDDRLKASLSDGEDVYCQMAAAALAKSADEVTLAEREWGHRIGRYLLEGTPAEVIADELSLSEEEADQLLLSYRGPYVQLHVWRTKLFYQAYECTEISTLMGRKVQLTNKPPKKERTALRFRSKIVKQLLRGSEADLIKWIVARLFAELPQDAPLLMVAGNRVLVEAPEARADDVVQVVRDVMQRPPEHANIQLSATIRVGRNWGSMRQWSPGQSAALEVASS